MMRISQATRGWRAASIVALVLSIACQARAQQVTLALDRFQELWKKAHPPAPETPAPSGSLVLESMELEAAVEGAVARLRATLTVALDGDVEQALMLPELGSILEVREESAGRAGSTIELARNGVGTEVRLLGPGRHRVVVESALPVITETASVSLERRLELELPGAAWITGSLTVGSEVREVVAVQGGLIVSEEPGRFRLLGEPGRRLVVRLSGAPREAPKVASDEPLIFDATSASALVASRARLRLSAWISVAVVSGGLETLSLEVPPGFEVLTVSGAQLLGWEVASGRLELTLRGPSRGQLAFEAQLAADPSVELVPKVLVPLGARQVRAAVKVALRSSDGLLESIDRHGAEAMPNADSSRWPQAFNQAPGEPLRLAKPDARPSWRVSWATSGQVLSAQIDRLLVEAVVGATGRVQMRIWAEIRNGEPSLVVTPPAGASLLRAFRDRVPVTLGEDGEAWVVPMVVQAAQQEVYVEALLRREFPDAGGRFVLPLPKLSVPASRVEVRLLLPPGFSYQLADGGTAGAVSPPRRGGSPLQPTPELAGLRYPPAGFSVVEAAWTGWSAEPPAVVVELEPASTRRKR